MDAETKREFERLHAKLNAMIAEKKKGSWVRVKVIKEATGWNDMDMLKARRNGYVEFKKDKQTGLWYNLDSLHEKFLKQTA